MACNDPAVKWIDGLPGQRAAFTVDGFNIPTTRAVPRSSAGGGGTETCRDFFLTHFHSDHTVGLHKQWAGGTVYCTAVTARLVRRFIGVDPRRFVVLPLDEPTRVVALGVVVTALDANHCPGAAMLLFDDGPSAAVLHTGDFRASVALRAAVRAALRGRRLSRVLLDTTYALPPERYRLPPQDAVLDLVRRLCRSEGGGGGRTRFVCGGYSVGKERVAFACAEAHAGGCRVGAADAEKLESLRLCGFDAVGAEDGGGGGGGASVVLASMRDVATPESLAGWLAPGFDRVVGFRPTGWGVQRCDRPPVAPHAAGEAEVAAAERGFVLREAAARRATGGGGQQRLVLYSVPYSEHSSWDELVAFVREHRGAAVMSTVGSAKERAEAVRALRGPQQMSIAGMFGRRGAAGVVVSTPPPPPPPPQQQQAKANTRRRGRKRREDGTEVIVVEDEDDGGGEGSVGSDSGSDDVVILGESEENVLVL